MDYPNISLDLETLGVVPGSGVLAIGAVVFDISTGDVDEENTFYRNIAPATCKAAGLTEQEDTVAFWNDPAQAKAKALLEPDQNPLAQALDEFRSWLHFHTNGTGECHLWSRGYMDEEVLGAAYRAIGSEEPWHYRSPRDARTFVMMVQEAGYVFGIMDPKEYIPHYALDDAWYDAKLISMAYHGIETRGGRPSPADLMAAHEEPGFRMEIREVVGSEEQYHIDAMRTAAGPEVFHQDKHSVRTLIVSMARFIAAARHLDAAKSALFYGKTKDVDTDDISPILASGGTDGHFDYAFIPNPQLIHACLGIMSEAGEIGEDLLLALQGKLENVDNLVRESGDIDWFQELLALVAGVSTYEGRCRNIYRLRQRFPDAFSEADAIARADEVPAGGDATEKAGADGMGLDIAAIAARDGAAAGDKHLTPVDETNR